MFGTFTSVMMLIIFLVPGFIWRSVEGQFVYLDRRLAWEKLALGLLTRSTLIYVVYGPLLYLAWKQKLVDSHPITVGWTALALLIVLPSALGLFVGWIRQDGWLVRCLTYFKIRTFAQHDVPTAWDAVFHQVPSCWIIVTLKGGRVVRGFLGSSSYISSDEEVRDIYISHVIKPDRSGFVEKTNGIYIKSDEIGTIELVHP